MRVVILGLSITSSWGNGHATTFRSLVKGLAELGHDVLFLERDQPWYASNRDLPQPPFGRTCVYQNLTELRDTYTSEVQRADIAIVGSYVPEGVAVGMWVTGTAKGVTAFYDIDTPVTVAKLDRQDFEYLTPGLAAQYDVYFSFTGGPMLKRLSSQYLVESPRVLHCSVDPSLYYPERAPRQWELGYLGTYSADRQPRLDGLLLAPAGCLPERRFAVAGSLYPEGMVWPPNVERIEHLPPAAHRHFYNSQRFTLNVTRADMVAAGYSPSVRLFEAAACGAPIISDPWPGLDNLFEIGREIHIASSREDVLSILHGTEESARLEMRERARSRILKAHTYLHRARELEAYAKEAMEMKAVSAASVLSPGASTR